MQKTFSTWAVVGGVFILLTALNQSAAAAEPADTVALSMRETSIICIPQEDLRKLAEHRCELIDAIITNVKFEDLCGAKGHAPMYSTVLYDCHPRHAGR